VLFAVDAEDAFVKDAEVAQGARAAVAVQGITVRFTVKGDAPAEKLRGLVDQPRARWAVFDIITNQVPVTIEMETA
jgi:hypothetical protein